MPMPTTTPQTDLLLPIDACDTWLDRFERRLKGDFLTAGLLLWTGGLRRCLAAVRARVVAALAAWRNNDRAAYEQLMLLETEVEAGKGSLLLLEHIGRIKGLLAALMLTVFVYATFCHDDAAARLARRRGSARDEVEVAAIEGGPAA